MKKDIFGWIVVVILIGGIALYGVMHPAPAHAPALTNTLELPAEGYTEHATYYDIAANYPTSTPLLITGKTANDTEAIAHIRKFISDTITEFKTNGNFDHLSQEEMRQMEGRKEGLEIKYLIGFSSRTVSYIFTTYQDTLGAHENMTFHTFTFDTKTGAELSLSDLFLPDSNYLAVLSQEGRAKLPAVIGSDADSKWIETGTMPDEKNFRNFFLDNQDLVFLFDPYQVASYADGPQTLRIPVSDLKDVLRTEYR